MRGLASVTCASQVEVPFGSLGMRLHTHTRARACTHTHTHAHTHSHTCTHTHTHLLCCLVHRFMHKNPEDPSEVPGGFVTDCNTVRTTASCLTDSPLPSTSSSPCSQCLPLPLLSPPLPLLPSPPLPSLPSPPRTPSRPTLLPWWMSRPGMPHT